MALLRWPLRVVGVVLALAVLYAAAALAGALIPVGGSEKATDTSEIYIRSNGIHLEFVLPNDATGPLGDKAVVDGASPYLDQSPYLAYGWGERDFFLNTPTWGDFDLLTAIHSLLWQTDILMRVQPVWRRPSGDHVRVLRVAPAQRAAIVAYIRASIRFNANGDVTTVPSRLYDPNGVFLEGVGTYSPFYTCNEWVNEGLKRAGIRTALWSPFPYGVMWQGE